MKNFKVSFTKAQITKLISNELLTEYESAEVSDMLEKATTKLSQKNGTAKVTYDNGVVDVFEITAKLNIRHLDD